MGEIFLRPEAPRALPFTGERMTGCAPGDTAAEHWHRYLLARRLAAGRDVLDIACGEGYGTALIAQAARSVVGVDLDEKTVDHAVASYPGANLSFRQGDACRIPLADASVDLVTSFETLEHFTDHAAFMREARRVLRPGGALLISTPDRDTYSPDFLPPNPFHAKELTVREFHDLLNGAFAHVQVLGQRVMLGSVLAPLDGAAVALHCVERRGADRFEASDGLARPRYLLALASDAPGWELPASIMVETGRIGALDGPGLEAMQSRVADLERQVAGLTERAEAAERQKAEAERGAADANRRIGALLGSTFWRGTAPLRWLVQRARGR